MKRHFNLAYPVLTVRWDGRFICAVDEEELEQSLDILQSVSIEKVMLAGYHLEEKSAFDMNKESKRIGQVLRERGMRPTQHHSVCPTFALSGTSQKFVVEHLCRCIEFTANLGAENMVIHAGRAFGHYDSVKAFCGLYLAEVERIGIDAMLEINAENLRAAGEYAEKCGVRIALENIDRMEPLCDPVCLPKLVDMIGLDNVGYCLDTGHAHCCGSRITAWIERMKHKIFTTHLHDNRGAGETVHDRSPFLCAGGIDEHLTPGLGTIDWRGVVSSLRRNTRLNDLTFETGGWPVKDRAEGYRMAIAFWRMVEDMAEE
ncbi:MAG: sugar phosphate isomerase/epimerase family protein [Victivallales bacterium]